MGLNWQRNDYFSMLMAKDKRGHAALEMLVDDLHTDKERSINRFLTHSGSEDFLWGLVKLLGNANSRVAGNAAYILGTLAESELGCIRVIGLTESRHPDAKNILSDLTNMLLFDDAESVMNAAGTMGTLAESVEGRGWMLKETCIMDTVQYITELLNNDNMWTASNAALVLARLTIAEEGCASILDHLKSEHILCRLVNSLGVDEAGRGMNAAFAIGRLCDIEKGRSRLLRLDESEKMISSLARMLCCSDPGASKNACFALSCLATNLEGHTRLLRNSHAEDVLRTLAELLSSEDSETGWFAAMTLRTLAAQPKGCVRLREHSAVLPALKAIESRDNINPDLKDEVIQTLEILKLIEKPQPPKVSVTGAKSVEVEWQESSTKSGFNIRYQIYEGGKCVYQGTDLMCSLSGLSPYTTYTYRLRPVTDGEDGPLSDPVSVTTEEAVPGPPLNVRILGCTTTQLKVGWEPPDCPNGVLKGYYVYIGDKQFEHTHELNSIITGLQPNTSYDLSVCTATSKGKGPRDTVSGTTAEMGAHAPSKPEVNVRGRNEMTVAWRAPEVPLGRITRYDVHMNGSVVYSGTDLHCVAQRLRPDTEYKFVVSAITGEGKCESKSTKKRTAKDEYEGDRAPLYQPPKREDQKDDLKQLPKKRKSISGESSNKAKSASLANAKAHAKLASLRNVKSATVKNRGDSPVQVVYKLTYSTAKHRQKEKEKTIVADPPPVVEPKPPAPEPPTIKAATPPPPPPPPAPKPAAVPVSPPPPKIKLQEPEQEKKQELKELQVVTTPKTPMIKDDGGHLGGRPLLHNNTPVHSEADYSKYQRTTTPEAKLKSLPKPKPPPMRNKQSSRYGNTDSASSSSSAKKTEENNNIVMKHKQGNDILTVEIDRKPEKKQRIKSSDILREGGKMSRRRSLKNTLSAVSGSSQDLEAEMLPPGERSGGGMRGGAGEAEASWLVHSRRYEAQGDITRTFSTLNMNHYRPPPLPRQSTSIMEFDPPIPMPGNKLAQSAAPGHVHRANTFIATHSKSVPLGGGKRGLDRIQAPRSPPNLSQSAHQWKPDFPQVAVKKNHNKFVPMQFRTQPVNLPGQLTRQRTSVGAIDGVGSELAVLNRSRTNIGGFGQGLLNPQEVAADLNNMHSTQTRSVPALINALENKRKYVTSNLALLSKCRKYW